MRFVFPALLGLWMITVGVAAHYKLEADTYHIEYVDCRENISESNVIKESNFNHDKR